MSTAAEQRATIIASVFSRRNASGNLEESYVSHVKIWEDAGPEGRKPRYILLSRTNTNAGFIHKSKLNNNGTYSVGKTWRLADLRGVQVLSSSAFNISLSKTYRWDTEVPQDQTNFLTALIDLYNNLYGATIPLRVEGMNRNPQPSRAPIHHVTSSFQSGSSTLSSTNGFNRPMNGSLASDRDNELPPPRAHSRNGMSRPASPASSSRSLGSRDQSVTPRPPSAASQSSSRPSRPHVSNNTVSSASSIPTAPLNLGIPASSSRTSLEQSTSPLKKSSVRSRPPSPAQPSRGQPVPAPPPPSSSMSRERRPSIPQDRREREPPPRAPRETNESPKPAARPPRPAPPPETRSRRDPNARISFFDHANQAALDRLLSEGDADGEDETSQLTLASVEEMIEGYEWASDDVIGRKNRLGAAELIEARLLDELSALEKANVHSFLETDDRVTLVMNFMDEALAELDTLDSLVSSYKIHLNAVGDDISFIQSQNRGLQVQTQNQRALLSELQTLLNTVQVSQSTLVALTQESLEKSTGIQRLEEAASELYKALQAGRDNEMAASMERLQEYRTHNSQFCKRILDFMSIMFTAQGKLLLGDSQGVLKDNLGRPSALPHSDLEAYLGRYAGLMLFLKEMDEPIYAKLCATYFSAASALASTQFKALFGAYLALVRRASPEEAELTFGSSAAPGNKPSTGVTAGVAAGMRRAGTLMRSPLDNSRKDKDKGSGDLIASEVFGLLLEQMASLIYHEDDFVADFLQINDAALTFADYMNLDSYFRRQASRTTGLSQTTTKLVRGAMDLIFGFLPLDLKVWLDDALAKDDIQIFGIIACLERSLIDFEEKGHQFLLATLEKQHTRLRSQLDRHIADQIRLVEQTKLTSKKRRGVVHFIKYFPVYVGRVETQLGTADGLEIRRIVDSAYDRLVQSMFECLKQMAKMEGSEGEDKGQMNYHVILIENMHSFVSEISRLEVGSVATFVKRANAIYEENVSAYVKLTLRRPFGKIIDYFEGIERLLKSSSPAEVTRNGNYSKSALKKVIKDFTAKDVRKHIEGIARRIEKHFLDGGGDNSQANTGAVSSLWQAFEDELVRITELFSKRIAQCYGDSGVVLEYTAKDIEMTFKRQKVGS